MSSIRGKLLFSYACTFVLGSALCILVTAYVRPELPAGISWSDPAITASSPDASSGILHIDRHGDGKLLDWLSDPAVQTTGAFCVAGASLLLCLYCSVMVLRRSHRDVRALRKGILALVEDKAEPNTTDLAFEEFRRCAADLESIAQELRKERANLSNNAFRDHLTGLQNRKPFMEALEREVVSALRHGRPLSCVMADLDHFKRLNDTHGHQAGDHVLQHTARRLESLVREGDVVARLGGEEFAILLLGADLKTGMRIAQQLRNALRCDELFLDDKKERVSASFGVAELFACNLTNPEDLLHAADMALYDAKRNGRDTVAAAPVCEAGKIPNDTRDSKPPDEEETADVADETEKRGPNQNKGIDRDTLALMGSTFSMLQAMPDKHRVAKDMIHQVSAVLRAGRVLLLVRDPRANELRPMAMLGVPSYEVVPSIPLPDEGLAGMISSPEVYYQPPEGDRILEALAPGPEPTSALYLPLSSDDGPFGIIVVLDVDGTAELTRRKNTVLQAISAIGATALLNCSLYEELEDRWMGSIETLSATIEQQDKYKRHHGARVGQVAIEVARSLGQRNGRQLKLLKLAGCLLDIGMLSVPIEIRQKKRRLHQSDRELIEQHAQIGFGILKHIAGMEQLAKIVLHHHEHFDGQGYPDRMERNDIPTESRILAVADAYCAMTSDRPYRPRLTHEEAVQRIVDASGTQFDPAIVDAFLACVNRSEEAGKTRTTHETRLALPSATS